MRLYGCFRNAAAGAAWGAVCALYLAMLAVIVVALARCFFS